MKKTIRFLTAILLTVMLLPTTVSASESSSYTYTQSVDKEWIRTQDAYMPGTIFLNDGTLSAPEDLFIFDNKIYIADAIVGEDGKVIGGQIVVYDMDSREIVSFGGETLVNPMGYPDADCRYENAQRDGFG